MFTSETISKSNISESKISESKILKPNIEQKITKTDELKGKKEIQFTKISNKIKLTKKVMTPMNYFSDDSMNGIDDLADDMLYVV